MELIEFFICQLITNHYLCNPKNPDVVKLVDTPDLGSGAARCVGSSPIIRTSKRLTRVFLVNF
jgi:hypothetical protein